MFGRDRISISPFSYEFDVVGVIIVVVYFSLVGFL
jgi:hypothetical protein